MNWFTWIFISALPLLWALAVFANRWRVEQFDRSGDPRQGTIIFVEPVRWLFIIWGFAAFCRGLRRAGRPEQIRLFRWSSRAGALLVIPDLARRDRLIRKARRLARVIEDTAREHPEAPLHLVGYSSGCYLLLEACRRATPGMTLGEIVLMGATVSPRYDLRSVSQRVERIHSFHSAIDLINLIGPMVFGSNDRCWGPACGTAGFQSNLSNLMQHPWRLDNARQFYFGDHFTIASPRFVSRAMAPLFGQSN